MEDGTDWRVLKFGGSSVASVENWRRIGSVVEARLGSGDRVLVVCSALGGVSDALARILEILDQREDPTREVEGLRRRHVDLAARMGVDPDLLGPDLDDLGHQVDQAGRCPPLEPRVRAELMARGELLSSRLGAAWLASRGLPAVLMDARQMLCARPARPGAGPGAFLAASCDHAPDPDLDRRLRREAGSLVVTQGFIARDPGGATVLLGRGGSDVSAACLAAKLGARGLEIWSDVPGLFTANPHRHPGARLLKCLSYSEAQALAAMGARALHPGCLAPVRDGRIPLRLGWTRHPQVEGTEISARSAPVDPGVRAVSSRTNLCMVSVSRETSGHGSELLAEVADCFRRHGLGLGLLASSPSQLRTTVDLSVPGAGAAMDGVLEDLGALGSTRLVRGAASVSLVGRDVMNDWDRIRFPGRAIREAGVHLVAHAADGTNLSYVVDDVVSDRLVEQLHDELFEDRAPDPVFGPTFRALVRRLESPTGDASARRHDPPSQAA